MVVVALSITGVINRTRALLAGRKGIRFFQHVMNVRLQLRKGSVYSTTTTLLFRIAPCVYLGAALIAFLFIPVANLEPICSFHGDIVFVAYLLALSRVALILAAMDTGSSFETELMGDVKAGFPSPAEDIREKLDLIKLLVKHKASTFFFRVDGVSMVDSGMDEGDILIVDRAIDPYNNCKAVCYIDGEYTVKRVEMSDKGVRLMPANENKTTYKPIEITSENNFLIWGVVTWVIKKM